MKLYNRRFAFLISVLIIACLFSQGQVYAAGSIDLSKDISLTIDCQDDGTPLVGAKFDIYLVATVDEHFEVTPEPLFNQYNVDIEGKDEESWRSLSSTLEGYVLRDHIPPADTGVTNAEGKVTFPSEGHKLTPGLYLVIAQRHIQDGMRYDISPFMVILPTPIWETGQCIYDVRANSKHISYPDEPDTITRKVLKVWHDWGHEANRPEEVIIQLLCDGEVYDTVPLNAENNWRHTWTELDDSYKWTVVEKDPGEYTVTVIREGITFVVKNRYDDIPPLPSEPDPVLPRTGQLWWPVPVLLFAGLLLIVIGLIRRRGAVDES